MSAWFCRALACRYTSASIARFTVTITGTSRSASAAAPDILALPASRPEASLIRIRPPEAGPVAGTFGTGQAYKAHDAPVGTFIEDPARLCSHTERSEAR